MHNYNTFNFMTKEITINGTKCNTQYGLYRRNENAS